MSRECKAEERVNILDCFMVNVSRSKPDLKTRCLVLKVSKVNRPLDKGKREREMRKILGSTVWYQPSSLQSPEVLSKEEAVVVTSKCRSAHK